MRHSRRVSFFMKISKNKDKKQAIVAEIRAKVQKAKAMVFTNYQGLTHKQLETFKRTIKKADAEFTVTKNTLLKRSLHETMNYEPTTTNQFDGQTGTLFLYSDIVTPLKTLAKMIKDMEKPHIKFGLLDGKLMTSAEVLKLSTLPSREVLIAQLLGQMQAPIAGLHRALNWNVQKFVMTLKAIEDRRLKLEARS